MKLEVIERLVLLEVLPKQGDYVTLKLVRKLRETLSFSEKEIAEIEFRNEWRCPKCERVELSAEAIECPDCRIYMTATKQVAWDEVKAKAVVKDVHLGDNMRLLCKGSLKRLDNEQKLTEQHMSLYSKFVEVDDETDGD